MTTTTSTSRRSSSNPPPVERAVVATPVGPVHVVATARRHGDFHPGRVASGELVRRRRSLVDLPWTMLDQRHGIDVVRVAGPGDADGEVGDVAITATPDAVLACWTADCAPLVLVSGRGDVAVVHAGWRGLAAGIVDVALAALGAPAIAALLGPVIGPCCYRFGDDDLAAVAAGVGSDAGGLRGVTRAGDPALDVPAAVAAACARHSIAVDRLGGCTGCAHPGYSHRVRRDPERQVVAAWRPA